MIPPLHRYEQTPEEDARLFAWWVRLQQLGELETTFGVHANALSRFYDRFRTGGFYYRLDAANRIGLAMLLVPTMTDCAFLTLWLSPAWRRIPRGLAALEESYEIALTHFPVLLGFTRQPALLAMHARWGYAVLGRLPRVFDGHDGWVVALTRESYAAAKAAGRPRQPTPNGATWEPAADLARSTA